MIFYKDYITSCTIAVGGECYIITISVAVVLAALFNLSDSLLTILLYIVVLSNKHVPSFFPRLENMCHSLNLICIYNNTCVDIYTVHVMCMYIIHLCIH